MSRVSKVADKDIRIVILQRGWVMVGHYSRKGAQCYLDNASVIRRWGTTAGLGELAAEGPKSNTILDPCRGQIECHELTVIATLKCRSESWPALR